MSLFDNDPYVSPGSLGGRIRKFRELEGLTQKQLGVKSGFAVKSSDVRISQYEKNKKIPRENIIEDIAEALDIDKSALYNADMLIEHVMYHALFDIEDFHGLHPVKINDKDGHEHFFLEFSGQTFANKSTDAKVRFNSFLKQWYEGREKYAISETDSEEDKENKQREYILWKAKFTNNIAAETHDKLRQVDEMNEMQRRVDKKNVELNGPAVFKIIDLYYKAAIDRIKASAPALEKESDLIKIILDIKERGLTVLKDSPEDRIQMDLDHFHLASFLTNEIMYDDEKRESFYMFEYAIETCNSKGLNVTCRITSRNQIMYLTYEYPTVQRKYFENIDKYWDSIEELVKEESDSKSPDKDHIQKIRDALLDAVTGEHDVIF